MQYGLTDEQEMIVSTVRSFVEKEIYPHEELVERTGEVPEEIAAEIKRKTLELGFYACNFPESVGCAGLNHVDFALVERELGRGSMALNHFFGRPQNILMACEGEQIDRYLMPAVRGERMDALAMTEPGAGSDIRGMKCAAVRDGGDWVVNGTKHFISGAEHADFIIVFIATGEDQTPKGPKKRITAFLVDRGTPGFTIRDGYKSVSHRGYKNMILDFDDCRLPDAQVLGEVDGGFEVMNTWLYATRITVAAMSVGRARRVFDYALDYAAQREQFGQPIGKFQGVSFQLADMITEIDAADLLTLAAADLLDKGLPSNRQIASAKLYASEMLGRVTDAAIQIHGGMGLMDDYPLERFWRDARVERIWDGTSEIQRHIISRDLLRALGPDMSDLMRMFQPNSLAVVGGGAWGEAVLQQAQKFGFPGTLFAVHPVKAEVAGFRAYPSVIHLPEVPDATFVGINREASIGAVERLRKLDAGGAVCFASGYAEATGADHTGADAQARLLRAAGDMPMLGPNCYGFINALDRVAVWPDQHGCRPVEKGVAILTQSSNIAINMTMQQRGLPIGYMITTGNQAQISQAQIAQALLDDDRVTAIGMHIEGFSNIAEWEALARKAHDKSIPLVALKVGKSAQARSATISHTASLAGADAAAQALMDRLGILRAPDVPSFLETLKLLNVTGRLESRNIASISCSGGEASLVADMALSHDLHFPELTSGQKQSLSEALGPKVALANPLDYHTYIWRDEDAMTAAWSSMSGPDIAMTLIVLDYPRSDICDPSDWVCATNAALRMRRDTGRPVGVVASLPELLPESVAQELLAGSVVPFKGITEALCAVSLAATPPCAPHGKPVLQAAPPGDTETLSEYDAKCALAAHGLAVPKAIQTNHSAAGLDALSFPVAVKAEGLPHKSDVGGVILDCNSLSDVQIAMDTMEDAASFHVEEMCEPGAELLIGVIHDPAHGHLLTVGAGGILTELLNDTCSLLIPSTREETKQALTCLKMYPLLAGYRGAAPCNIDALLDAIEAIQSYVIAQNGAVAEVEVNPLICGPDSAIAADALIRKAP